MQTKSAVAEEPPKQEDSEKAAAESAEETPVVEEDVCMDASEIEVRLGANWIKAEYITDFMERVFKTPSYYIGSSIKATYSEISGAWNISGKSLDRSNPRVTNTYGTMRVNGYRLLLTMSKFHNYSLNAALPFAPVTRIIQTRSVGAD